MANANVVDSQSDEEEGDAYFDLFFSKTNMPTYKVILLGDTGAGKTSLFLRYKHGNFRKGSTLYGADRYMKDFLCEDGEKVQMVLWDTAGMERMGSLTFHYYHQAHAVLLVYSLNDRTTFDNLGSWNEDAINYTKDTKRFLVATKNDILQAEVDVSKERAKAFCKNNNISGSYSTSAKTGQGVDEMFEHLVKTLRETVNPVRQPENVWGVALQGKTNMKQSNCNGC